MILRQYLELDRHSRKDNYAPNLTASSSVAAHGPGRTSWTKARMILRTFL